MTQGVGWTFILISWYPQIYFQKPVLVSWTFDDAWWNSGD